MSAPALAKRSMYFSGLTIIRCVSSTFFVPLRIGGISGNPNEMFGTNTPSITSMCTHSASLRSSIAMSSAKCPKSAESTEGDMILFMFSEVLVL